MNTKKHRTGGRKTFWGITKLSMVLLIIGLAICSNIVAWGADWKLLDVSDTCTYFYDK